ncbi:MAG: sulfatase [Bacteroidia bacterium]
MLRHYKVFTQVIVVLLFQCKSTLAQQSAKRPNIIFIMSDDHACKAISCYDGSINKTPQIDRIAKNGVRFTNCFCTNAVCGPSRATILTGQLTHINGMINNEVVFDSSSVTLPKILRANGYQTAIVGKWHLKSDPTGFDYWKILPGQGEYFNPDFIENGKKIHEQGYVTDLIAEYALDWLNKRDTAKPFFIMIHNKAPHRPWLPKIENAMLYDTANIPLPVNFYDDYSNRADAAKDQKMSIVRDLELSTDLKLDEELTDENKFQINFGRLSESDQKAFDSVYAIRNKSYYESDLRGYDHAVWKYRRYIDDYLATIKTVDDKVGEVLDYLKAHNLEENTIVVYTSDQGFFLGEHGWFDKRFMYDESYRMPLLIQYPAKIKAGNVNDQLLMNIDFAPTLLEWAGISKPQQMQGVSFANYIDNKERLRHATYYHYFEYPGEHAVKRHYGIRTEKYKLIHYYYDIDQWELFDLQSDPHEMMNVYNNPAYTDIQKDITAQLKKMQTEYADTNFAVPMSYAVVQNKILNQHYSLAKQPSPKYPDNKNKLTDGKIENPEFKGTHISENWIGFEADNFEMMLPIKSKLKATEIEIRFLDLPDSWIFKPDSVMFYFKNENDKYISPGKPIITEEKRTTGGNIIHYKVQYLNGNINEIKIKAINHGVCPAGHAAAGKPAWIFTDEVIVR